MKKEALKILIKDIVILLIMQILAVTFMSVVDTGKIWLWLFITGIPFGWKWASNIITAVSFKGVQIKLLFSVFLGAIAIFVVFIKDIIRVLTAPAHAE